MNVHMIMQPHKDQRYDTVGDWYFDEDGDLIIKVSNDLEGLGNEYEQLLVALHELVEVLLCRKRGISQKVVDDFDFAFKGEGEPGDEVEAPYRKEHRFAMLIEHLLAHELGLTPYGKVE